MTEIAIHMHISSWVISSNRKKQKKTSMDVNEEKTLDLSHHQLQKWDIKKAVQILRGKILHFQMFLLLVLKYIYCTLFILLCRGKTNEEDFLFSSYPSISKRQPVDLPSKWFFRGISESSMARPTQQQAWEFVWDWFLNTFKGTNDQKGDIFSFCVTSWSCMYLDH